MGRASAGTALTEWMAAPVTQVGGGGDCGDPLGPARRPGVGEPALDRLQGEVAGGPEASGEVAGVQEGEPDAGLGRRLHQSPAHSVVVCVGPAARSVVQVVELADRCDAGDGHLAIGGPAQRHVGIGVEPTGQAVHPIPPGPKRPSVVVGAPPQGPVKGVAVGVGQSRQDHPG